MYALYALRLPPRGGGSNAYKAYIRKPKGFTRLTRLTRSIRAFRRVIIITIADQRYRVENRLLLLEKCLESLWTFLIRVIALEEGSFRTFFVVVELAARIIRRAASRALSNIALDCFRFVST